MAIEHEIVRVTTTGSAGSATGSAQSAALSGFLAAIFVDYHASAPATTDVTIAYDEPDLGTIIVLTNTATDAMHLPRKQASDAAGAAISGLYDLLPLIGNVSVSVAGCDALTNAVVVHFLYVRV